MNDQLVEIPEFAPNIRGVLWEMWALDKVIAKSSAEAPKLRNVIFASRRYRLAFPELQIKIIRDNFSIICTRTYLGPAVQNLTKLVANVKSEFEICKSIDIFC